MIDEEDEKNWDRWLWIMAIVCTALGMVIGVEIAYIFQ